MNCDQVFDILTRGPFPTGDASDAAVERHLCACHECRELAEALRPAVSLLHESIEAEESADLPGYRGALMASIAAAPVVSSRLPRGESDGGTERRSGGGKVVAHLSPTSIVSPHPVNASSPHRSKHGRFSMGLRATLLRVAAAATLAGALAALIVGVFANDAGDGNPPLGLNSAPSLAGDADTPLTLASLDLLPRECHELTGAFPRERRHEALCCTRCHSQASPKAPPLGERLVLVARSCQLCHES